MNVNIILEGIEDEHGRKILLKRDFPLTHDRPNLDYLAKLSKGDDIVLNTHDTSTEFQPFSSIHGEVVAIKKWVSPHERQIKLRRIIIRISKFHVSTYKTRAQLNEESGQKEILQYWRREFVH